MDECPSSPHQSQPTTITVPKKRKRKRPQAPSGDCADQPDDTPPAVAVPVVVNNTVEDCLHTVRESLRNPAKPTRQSTLSPWTTTTSPDDQGGPVSHRDATGRDPTTVLQQCRVVDNTWTHILLRPSYQRARVLAQEDARDLYTGLTHYACAPRVLRPTRGGARPPGMGIMERVMSHVTRLSIVVEFPNSFAPDGDAEAARMQQLLDFITPALYASLPPRGGGRERNRHRAPGPLGGRT